MPTVQEPSISAQLRALVRLQRVDSELDHLAKLRGDLPNEIGDLEDEKSGLDTRLENYAQEAQDHAIALKQLENDIRDSENLIRKYTEQQNTVRNNREYDALTKEIEAQRQRIIDAQGRIDEMKAAEAPRLQAIDEARVRLEELDTLLREKRGQLSHVLDDTRLEQEELEKRRATAAEAVDERYLRAYNRLRTRMRDGRAVVPLERGAASGYAVPPQRQVDVRQRNRIIVCENTGRIIVDEELYNEEFSQAAAE